MTQEKFTDARLVELSARLDAIAARFAFPLPDGSVPDGVPSDDDADGDDE